MCSDLAEDVVLQFCLPFFFPERTMFQHTLFNFVPLCLIVDFIYSFIHLLLSLLLLLLLLLLLFCRKCNNMPLLEWSILFEVQFCLKFCFEVQFYCFIYRLKCSLSVFVLHFFSGGLDDSVILANDVGKISQLNTWLLPHLQSSDRSYWKLCYRATSHGWRGQTFHSYCDNKGPTVTIVRDGSYIFGGYNDNSWKCKSLKYGEHVAMTL